MIHPERSDGRRSRWGGAAGALGALVLGTTAGSCVSWPTPNPEVPPRDQTEVGLNLEEADESTGSGYRLEGSSSSAPTPIHETSSVRTETLRGLNRTLAEHPDARGWELMSPYFDARNRDLQRSTGGVLTDLVLLFGAAIAEGRYGSGSESRRR